MGLVFLKSNFFINRISQGRKSVHEKSTFSCTFAFIIFHSAEPRNWIFTLPTIFMRYFNIFWHLQKQRLKIFIKCDFRMVLTTFFFAFLHTIKLPQYIWKGNLLLVKCIPSFSHERRILGPLLECRLRMACGLTSYSKVYDYICCYILLCWKSPLVLK